MNTKGERKFTFEQQQEINYIRNGVMGKACAGLTTAELKNLNPGLLKVAPDLYKALEGVLSRLKLVGKGTFELPADMEVIKQAEQALAKAEEK